MDIHRWTGLLIENIGKWPISWSDGVRGVVESMKENLYVGDLLWTDLSQVLVAQRWSASGIVDLDG